MKKTVQLLAAILLIALFATGCKKSATVKPATTNKFTFNGTAYTSLKFRFAKSDHIELMEDSAISDDHAKTLLIDFFFNYTGNAPVAGTYSVVSAQDFNGSFSGANETAALVAEITNDNPNLVSEWYTNANGGNVIITSNGGKLTAATPVIQLYGSNYVNGSETPTISNPTLPAITITEQ